MTPTKKDHGVSGLNHECADYQARQDAAAAMAFAERVEQVTSTKLDHIKELSTQTLDRLGHIEDYIASMQKREGAWKLKAATSIIVVLLGACGALFTKAIGW